MRFTALIKDGKINWHNEGALAEHLNLIDSEEVYIDIKPSKVRNTAQNNYYWAIVRKRGNHIGHYPDEMHKLIKWKFKVDSTKNLNKEEFHDLLDRLIIWSGELEFPVRDPRATKLP